MIPVRRMNPQQYVQTTHHKPTVVTLSATISTHHVNVLETVNRWHNTEGGVNMEHPTKSLIDGHMTTELFLAETLN